MAKDVHGDEWTGVLQGKPTEPEPKTEVIFRKWNSRKDGYGVIALFPETVDKIGICRCYEHEAGYGTADYAEIMRRTTPAMSLDYAKLRDELYLPPNNCQTRVVARRRAKKKES